MKTNQLSQVHDRLEPSKMAHVVVLRVQADHHTFYGELEPQPDPKPYLPAAQLTYIDVHATTVQKQLQALHQLKPDLIINLCDGCIGEDRPGVDVVQTLDRMGYAYTGASPHCYDITRNAQKMAAHSAGVRIPAYVELSSLQQLDQIQDLKLPVIVKHPRGYNSVGLTPDSMSDDLAVIAGHVGHMITEYGAALVEEFIEGREYTVIVSDSGVGGAEPVVYAPLEFVFPANESFKHFDLKWVDYEMLKSMIVEDPLLVQRLQHASRDIYVGLGHDGYARIDFRMNRAGELFFLEINSNPSIFYPAGEFGSADSILDAQEEGFALFMDNIHAAARRRSARSNTGISICFDRQSGFGVQVNRAFARDEVVLRCEESSFRLVSKEFVDQHWSATMQGWFAQYAYPLTEQIYVFWDKNPNEWKPINHSCDPNLRLQGLDHMATRAIRAGEQLTLDYATFCGPDMQEFACDCGSQNCRGVVRGSYLDSLGIGRGQLTPDGRAPYEIRALGNGVGVGLFAERAWEIGACLAPLEWQQVFPTADRWTLQIGDNQHIEIIPHEARYVNHSCHPNVFYNVDAKQIEVISPIRTGDQITFFYPANEWQMSEQFKCHCGHEQCLGFIGGAKFVSPDRRGQFRFNAHITALFENEMRLAI